MGRKVEWLPRAKKDLKGLEPKLQERILDAIDRYAETDQGDVIKLTDRPNEYRLRVGEYRVIFAFLDNKLIVLVLRVLNRKDAYKT